MKINKSNANSIFNSKKKVKKSEDGRNSTLHIGKIKNYKEEANFDMKKSFTAKKDKSMNSMPDIRGEVLASNTYDLSKTFSKKSLERPSQAEFIL